MIVRSSTRTAVSVGRQGTSRRVNGSKTDVEITYASRRQR